MSLTKHLGKITSVNFGLGGYQDATLGLHLCFEFDGGSHICTSKSAWDFVTIEHSTLSKWTEQSRLDKYAEIMCFVSKTLNQASIRNIGELKNIPVEITMDGMSLYAWRILKEVL